MGATCGVPLEEGQETTAGKYVSIFGHPSCWCSMFICHRYAVTMSFFCEHESVSSVDKLSSKIPIFSKYLDNNLEKNR